MTPPPTDRGRRGARVAVVVLAAATLLAFAAIVVAADRGALPPLVSRLYAWPGGDKAGHVGLLAVLTFTLALALRGRRVSLGPWTPPLAAVLAAAGITVEEASQALFPGRTLSPLDLACSYLGVYLGARLAGALLARGSFRPVGGSGEHHPHARTP
ncbi:hypothetical protein [Roseisolibacter sp. H3M3-2]|uniref:hypothetical protein n=1 Tax=Roseisolibacter sp. H3M3-2 TaxID=3031323 RepID=UPI0023DBDCC5|nr:hypothetical protein [Roseisolibacter sp. H3M3-2]MDF1505821.1 hypothetical protein [Roseisolibacter sp. H3M3-2]